jgi:hypothetical protein
MSLEFRLRQSLSKQFVVPILDRYRVVPYFGGNIDSPMDMLYTLGCKKLKLETLSQGHEF